MTKEFIKNEDKLEKELQARIASNYGISDSVKERFMRAKHKRARALDEMREIYWELKDSGKWEMSKDKWRIWG